MPSVISRITARAIPLRGNDIDTDRIIPARYLRCVTFDGLGEHVFEDDRAQLKAAGKRHSFDDARFHGAQILVANRNFGCGSSREHAPQAIAKWGIRAIIAVSYSEIFFGNCVALGIPAVQVALGDAERLQTAIEGDPERNVELDLEAMQVRCGPLTLPCQMAEGPRRQFLTGAWDATGELLAGLIQVRETAARLPYLTAFGGR